MDDVVSLYLSAFPADERRETIEFFQLLENNPRFRVDGFADEGGFIGFLSSWAWSDMRYCEHFAVDARRRGGGFGSEILSRFVGEDTRPVILEVEPPTDSTAERRIDFYRRSGFRLWRDVPYTQPPYGEGRKPVDLMLMTYGDITLTPGDERIRRLLRDVYRQTD